MERPADRMDDTAPTSDPSPVFIEDVMTAAVVSLEPSTPVGRARDLMLGLGIHGLPVIDDRGAVIGLVTGSDLVEQWPHGEPVETVMSRRLVTIEAGATAVEGAEKMLEAGVHHLLAIRDGAPAGVVSSLDLLKAFVTQHQRRTGERFEGGRSTL